jgi:hypothetical protein
MLLSDQDVEMIRQKRIPGPCPHNGPKVSAIPMRGNAIIVPVLNIAPVTPPKQEKIDADFNVLNSEDVPFSRFRLKTLSTRINY